MAIIHRAELRPSKTELLRTLLEGESWEGELEVLGAYRFDDPAGEVGVECHLLRVGESVLHVPLTYRGAPLPEDTALVGTLEHSVLGRRWVYDGLADEVALDCFRRALTGEQQQAELEIHEDGAPVGTREQSVRLRLEVDAGERPPRPEELLDGEPFTIARTVGGLDGAVRLVARWAGGQGVVAAV